jgi:hypothetical protein
VEVWQGRAVFAGKTKLIAMLLVVAFGFGLILCHMACRHECGDDCARDHATHQCAGPCLCQIAALPVIVSSDCFVESRPQQYVVIAESLKLTAFPTEIFNPPKA